MLAGGAALPQPSLIAGGGVFGFMPLPAAPEVPAGVGAPRPPGAAAIMPPLPTVGATAGRPEPPVIDGLGVVEIAVPAVPLRPDEPNDAAARPPAPPPIAFAPLPPSVPLGPDGGSGVV